MSYERVNWENEPSEETPVNADNLNKMDEGIEDNDSRISDIDSDGDGKVDEAEQADSADTLGNVVNTGSISISSDSTETIELGPPESGSFYLFAFTIVGNPGAEIDVTYSYESDPVEPNYMAAKLENIGNEDAEVDYKIFKV